MADVLVAVEDILWWIGGVTMPEGDPDQTRAVAAAWGKLAQRLDESGTTTLKDVTDVWTTNTGKAIDEFKAFWTSQIEPYPGEISAYCRKIENSCTTYAKALDDIRFALVVLAIQTYLNILFTIAYGWITGWAGIAAELIIVKIRAKAIADAALSIFEQILLKILEYLIDSIAYAGLQQILQLGVFAIAGLFRGYDNTTNQVIGYNPFDLGANFKQFLEGFAGNMAFDGVLDLAHLGLTHNPLFGQALTDLFKASPSGWQLRLAKFGERMIGSTMYTIVSDATGSALDGQPDSQWLPTWNQMIDKLLMHGTRMAKNPALGPIFSDLLP